MRLGIAHVPDGRGTFVELTVEDTSEFSVGQQIGADVFWEREF